MEFGEASLSSYRYLLCGIDPLRPTSASTAAPPGVSGKIRSPPSGGRGRLETPQSDLKPPLAPFRMTIDSHALQCDGPSHCRAGSPPTGRLAPKRASGRSGATTTRRQHTRRGHPLCDLSRFSIDFNRFFQGKNPTSSADVYKRLRRWEAFCGESVEYDDLISK